MSLIDLPIDSTALAAVATCGRRYQLSCVYGVDGNSPEARWGSAFHRFLELRGKGDKTVVLDILPAIAKEFNIDVRDLVLPAIHWDSTQFFDTPISDKDGHPCIEYKFSYPVATVLDKYRIIYIGTIDRIVLIRETPIIVDFKTTQVAKNIDKLMYDYLNSFQIKFYMYNAAKFLHHFMPDPIAEKFRRLQFAGQYQILFRSFTPPKVERSSWISLTSDLIPVIEEQLTILINKIISINERETLYPAEGQVSSACFKCPFKDICMIQDQDRLLETISHLPRRKYDPTNFR